MEKNFSWEELFEFLELESNEIEQTEETISYNDNFFKYFTDYMNISYLEEIKESDLYLINKWKRIFFSCSNLSDYFYYLEKPFKTNSDSTEIKKIIPNISSENSNSSILSLSQSKELINSNNDINIIQDL